MARRHIASVAELDELDAEQEKRDAGVGWVPDARVWPRGDEAMVGADVHFVGEQVAEGVIGPQPQSRPRPDEAEAERETRRVGGDCRV